MVESLLDQVPGLGEVRRKALMSHFGSLKKLRQASVEEIAAVPGFGPKLAQSIKAALEATPQREAINTATGEIIGDEPLPHPDVPAPVAAGLDDPGAADGEGADHAERVMSAVGDREPGY